MVCLRKHQTLILEDWLFYKNTDMATKASEAKKTEKKKTKKAEPEKEDAAYNWLKDFHGQKYSGMKIGLSHTWQYDAGKWKETKITPDEWEFTFKVTKRRAGRARRARGIGGHGLSLVYTRRSECGEAGCQQLSTNMLGVKFKIAHKRADKEKWSLTRKDKRKSW
jgi:hypothetical protein